jgi:DNA-binding GntR family transcriptional regulator
MTVEGGLRPASRRSLADEVADRIRTAIFAGAYAPGEQLRELELAAALDVSRGPIREALLHLEREGLIRSAWHRGARVMSLTDDDLAELASLRAALEQLAVNELVLHATDDDFAAIDASVTAMTRATDAHAMAACDIAFHDAIYGAAHHRRLEQAWYAIRSQIHLFLLTRIGAKSDNYLALIPAEHRELAQVLRTRNADHANELFAAHRKHALDIVTRRTT